MRHLNGIGAQMAKQIDTILRGEQFLPHGHAVVPTEGPPADGPPAAPAQLLAPRLPKPSPPGDPILPAHVPDGRPAASHPASEHPPPNQPAAGLTKIPAAALGTFAYCRQGTWDPVELTVNCPWSSPCRLALIHSWAEAGNHPRFPAAQATTCSFGPRCVDAEYCLYSHNRHWTRNGTSPPSGVPTAGAPPHR
jgi:hypothetical protein